MKRLAIAAVGALLLSTVLAACGDDGDDSGSGSSGDKTKLTVFAASSLTNPFDELAKTFESDHSDVDVVLTYDSSTTLATQITEGSPADVLATADEKSMQIVVDAGDNAGDPANFATNTMAIVTPPDNPAGIQSLEDLKGTDFVMCDPSVPCGAVSQEVLSNAGVDAQPVSLEDKVTAVLAKVVAGEADAGIVYVSDAQGAGEDVATVDIPDDVNVTTPYYIATIKDAPNADPANEWVDLVTSSEGQGVMADYGFGSMA